MANKCWCLKSGAGNKGWVCCPAELLEKVRDTLPFVNHRHLKKTQLFFEFFRVCLKPVVVKRLFCGKVVGQNPFSRTSISNDRRNDAHRELSLRKCGPCFEFSCVCPEPVLVKCSFLYICKWRKRTVFTHQSEPTTSCDDKFTPGCLITQPGGSIGTSTSIGNFSADPSVQLE